MNVWDLTTWPLSSGGHTNFAFITTREKNLIRKGRVIPMPLSNFLLISKEDQKHFTKAFKKKGYILELQTISS